jgi:catechol 2,3-dioxygenase-like lactoylglutathione lyase family enzyme
MDLVDTPDSRPPPHRIAGEAMKIPRLTLLTLGVADLDKATQFYKAVLGTPPNRSYEGVTFIELPGTWLALYPPLTCGKRAWGASYTTLRQPIDNPDPGFRSPPQRVGPTRNRLALSVSRGFNKPNSQIKNDYD